MILRKKSIFDPGLARVSLGIATFFTISQQTGVFNSGLPKVSYIKMIDIWMITCNVFVFATLLEYSTAQLFERLVKEEKDRKRAERLKKDKKITI